MPDPPPSVPPEVRRLLPVQPRTMVEQAAEAIVAAAARGAFLPGDRLVEAEIARDLGISRVPVREADRKSTRLNSSHANISYAVFCLKKKTNVPGFEPTP